MLESHYPLTLLWRIRLSSSPGFPVIAGQWWRRPNGKIQARYADREELEACNWATWALTRELTGEEPDRAEAWRWTDYNGMADEPDLTEL